MWLEIFMIPFILTLVIFIIFWIVKDGQRWQKHPRVGVFARFIQKSPGRALLTFVALMIALVVFALLIMTGLWMDKIISGVGPERTDVVNVMLVTFLVLCFTIYISWGAFGTWRNARRAEAEMRVRPT